MAQEMKGFPFVDQGPLEEFQAISVLQFYRSHLRGRLIRLGELFPDAMFAGKPFGEKRAQNVMSAQVNHQHVSALVANPTERSWDSRISPPGP